MRTLRQNASLGLILGLFLGTIAAAWGWFQLAPAEPVERLQFEVRAALDGWRFEDRALHATSLDILATRDVVNGVFHAEEAGSVTVFAAAWNADNPRQMSVVQHTPDVCWVGVGWEPVAEGQPGEVTLEIHGRPVRFQCRLFAAPGGHQRELVLWCTLVGGQVLEESERWHGETRDGENARSRFAVASRRLAAGQFLDNLRHHRAATASKQFVRVSMPVGLGDWQKALEWLSRFAPLWLNIPPDKGSIRRSAFTPESSRPGGPTQH
ncbi:MAG: exosortase-associated EpsI family protein [Verrucomicrobiales bacterium]|nr:exosortase-associated EpsI family protein [Verrucomicrobiales bacterium]